MSVLATIADATRRRISQEQNNLPEGDLRRTAQAQPTPPSFKEALSQDGVRLIAEIKRASPSAGALATDLDAAQLAMEYEQAGAAAISVLTEPDFFNGKLEDLVAAGQQCHRPRLMKDFVLEEYQLLQARAAGASAALLIVALLDPDHLRDLLSTARGLGLDALVEVHNQKEAESALAIGADIIGVNNRDLKSLEVDLQTSHDLAPLLKEADCILVSESGIRSAAEIASLRSVGYQAFLVGSHLISSGHPGTALRELLA
jgi:indole-3-glycerol phosphate synthase